MGKNSTAVTQNSVEQVLTKIQRALSNDASFKSTNLSTQVTGKVSAWLTPKADMALLTTPLPDSSQGVYLLGHLANHKKLPQKAYIIGFLLKELLTEDNLNDYLSAVHGDQGYQQDNLYELPEFKVLQNNPVQNKLQGLSTLLSALETTWQNLSKEHQHPAVQVEPPKITPEIMTAQPMPQKTMTAQPSKRPPAKKVPLWSHILTALIHLPLAGLALLVMWLVSLKHKDQQTKEGVSAMRAPEASTTDTTMTDTTPTVSSGMKHIHQNLLKRGFWPKTMRVEPSSKKTTKP